MKAKGVFSVISAIILIACSESSKENPTAIDYAQLKVGNYWIYEWYELDTNDVRTDHAGVDCVYVERDTIMNNKSYFFINGKYFGHDQTCLMLSDSDGCLIDEYGKIKFSVSNFVDTLLIDTVVPNYCYVIYTMKNKNEIVSTPSGTYKTYNYHGDVYVKISSQQWDLRDYDTYYAKDIGMVKQRTLYIGAPNTLERVLLRYSLNKN